MSLQGKEVLILDDDEIARRLLAKALEGAGLRVRAAASVPEALAAFAAHPPHAMLVDLRMGPPDGFDFLEARRTRPKLRAVPALVLSALNDRSSIYRAMSLGADDYLVKPFDTQTLLRKLRKALKDQGFSSRAVPDGLASVRVSAPCRVTHVSEAGILVDSPVRLAPDTDALVVAKLLGELGVGEHRLRSEWSVPLQGSSGYETKLVLLGVTEEAARKVRQAVTRWR